MSLQSKIDDINRLNSELSLLLPMTEENRNRFERKIWLEFHYNTNHIEGNTLTYSETKLALLFDQVAEGHTLREYEEMKASDTSYKYMQSLVDDKERPLSESSIKELNQILLVRPYWKDAITEDGQPTRRLISVGEYKRYPNSVRLQNGEIFHYATPAETPSKMHDLIEWYRIEESKNELHPIELAALLHYKFVCIHPFDDGNGRVSRLLMNYVLLKHNYPPVVIKTDDKANYLRALNQADSGDMNAFVAYVSEQLKWSLELSIKAAKGESLDELQDWKKKLQVLTKELSKNKEIKKKKSVEVTQEFIKTIFTKIVDSLMFELAVYDDYFLSVRKYYWAGTDRSEYDKAIPFHFALSTEYGKHYYHEINFGIAYNEFTKNGTNPFNLSYNLRITFTDYHYNIFIDSKMIVSKLYHEDITNDELDAINNLSGEFIVNAIQLALNIDGI